MPVEVRPTEFSMVFFDAAEIQGIVEKLVAEIGLPGDLSVTVEIDETTPMGRARVASIDPRAHHRGVGRARGREGAAAAERGGHARRDRQAALLGRATGSTPPSASRPPTTTSRCRSRWRGRSTAWAGSAGSATRCSASAASTSSATATASPTPPTPRSSGSGRPTTSPGPTSRDLPRGPRRPPCVADRPTARSAPAARAEGARRTTLGACITQVVGGDRLEEVDLGRAGQQARAALGHRDHVGRVEVRLLVLRALPLLDDHEPVRLGGGHGQVDVAAARGGPG